MPEPIFPILKGIAYDIEFQSRKDLTGTTPPNTDGFMLWAVSTPLLFSGGFFTVLQAYSPGGPSPWTITDYVAPLDGDFQEILPGGSVSIQSPTNFDVPDYSAVYGFAYENDTWTKYDGFQFQFVLPDTPTGLNWDGICRGTEVPLTWTAVSHATSYNLYNFGTLYQSGILTNGVTLTLTTGTTYQFTITAVVYDESLPSSSITVVPCCPTPGVPQSFTGLGYCEGAQQTLSWNAVAGAASYTVYQDGSLFEGDIADTSYVATGLTVGVSYSWTVTSTNPCGTESGQSTPYVFTPCDECDPPASPTGFVVNRTCIGGQAVFGWDAGDPDTTLTLAYWCGSQETATTVTFPGDSTGTTISGLCEGVQCFATLTASDMCGPSDPTAPLGFKPCCPCSYEQGSVPSGTYAPSEVPAGVYAQGAVPSGQYRKPCGCQ